MRIGLIGYRTPGFYDVGFNELELRRVIGPEVYQIDLAEVFAEVDKISKEEVNKIREEILEIFDVISSISDETVEKYA